MQDQIEQETVVLMEGANFELDFVKKSPQATLPAIITPDGKLYDSTITVIDYLIKNSPNGATPADPKLLEIVHADNIDPNFFMLAARSKEELAEKNKSVPGDFLRGRQKTLERVAPIAPPELKAFYDAKLAGNGGLLAIYAPGASDELTVPFFKVSHANWDAVGNFIDVVLPKYLPEQGFIGGDIPGEADFHVGAWLARIAQVLGASSEKGQSSAFGTFGTVPPRVAEYWDAWVVRNSWNVVYKEGLH